MDELYLMPLSEDDEEDISKIIISNVPDLSNKKEENKE